MWYGRCIVPILIHTKSLIAMSYPLCCSLAPQKLDSKSHKRTTHLVWDWNEYQNFFWLSGIVAQWMLISYVLNSFFCLVMFGIYFCDSPPFRSHIGGVRRKLWRRLHNERSPKKYRRSRNGCESLYLRVRAALHFSATQNCFLNFQFQNISNLGRSNEWRCLHACEAVQPRAKSSAKTSNDVS